MIVESDLEILGSSPPMQRVGRLIRKAAASEAAVLIVDESGAGKELVARFLHASGPREAGPFVDVDCAALTESFLERFAQAHGGTIFLDEIGDLPPPMQARLLPALEPRSWTRIPFDVRVICATRRNLEEEAARGRFRKDLFYRINTLVIELPPLPPAAGLTEAVERLERSLIRSALDQHGWVKARASRALGITERILSYKMTHLGIQRPSASRIHPG